jgi:hypothetical protein
MNVCLGRGERSAWAEPLGVELRESISPCEFSLAGASWLALMAGILEARDLKPCLKLNCQAGLCCGRVGSDRVPWQVLMSAVVSSGVGCAVALGMGRAETSQKGRVN